MRRIILFCALVLVLLTATSSFAEPQIQINPGDMPMMLPPGRPAKTGTGRLRGRVIASDTGTIIRRAQVRISSPDIGSKQAFTDAQGRFEFRDLPAGRFNISVSKSGFVSMQYGQNRPFEPGRPIDLTEGQVLEKADVALPRGSAVQGRVLDEFGEPVADASVTAMRMQYASGKRRLAPMGRASMTTDLGQFRLFGLPPGEYYVSVSVRTIDTMIMDMLGGSSAGGPTGSNTNSGYAPTYYPGTPNPGEAQRLTLAVGQELSSIDIQMQPVRLARIAGNAVSSDGKPMSGAMVMMIPTMKDAIAMMPGGTSRTDKDGNFTLNGVAPGEYSIQVQSLAAMMSAASQAMSMIGGGESPTPAAPAAPLEREFAVATVAVTGEDITGLVITGTRGAKASGRIVFEGGQKPETITSLRLIALPTDPDNMSAASSAFGMASVKDTGTFEVDGLVGGRTFRFISPPKGWHLKRITHDGNEITDTGHDFKPGEDVEGFEIVLTTHTQSITGSVTNAKGEAQKEYTVVVFPEDERKWTLPNSRWTHSARPDQQGQFKVNELPAGSYLAIAVEYVAQGEWNDPEWLRRNASRATKVTIDEGATKTLDLKLAGS
jgi:hypothetical protein